MFEPKPNNSTATAQFQVLRNDQHQHALWPAHLTPPAGWEKMFGPHERHACVDYVRQHWTDMRPRALQLAQDVQEAA